MAQALDPYLDAQQLGAFAAKVKAFGRDPSQASTVWEAVLAELHAHPQARTKMPPRLTALGALASRYRPPTEPTRTPSRPAPTRRPAAAPRESDREQTQRVLGDRQRHEQAMRGLYAHPDYQRQLQGAPDTELSEEYLTNRKALFGKRRRRRR